MTWICAEVALTILANLETGALPCNSKIDNTGFVRCRSDHIGSTVFVQINSTSISVETQLLVIEAVVG